MKLDFTPTELQEGLAHYPDRNDCLGCERGQGHCARPCSGLPAEIMKIIEAGEGHRLMIESLPLNGKTVELLSPANPGYERELAPVNDYQDSLRRKGPLFSGCVFQDKQSKACTLHARGLKPYEGRKSCCKNNWSYRDSVCTHVFPALAWDSEEGLKVLQKWKQAYRPDLLTVMS